MTDLEKVKGYVKEKGEINLPQLQKDLGLTYGQARDAARELVKRGVLKYIDGFDYRQAGLNQSNNFWSSIKNSDDNYREYLNLPKSSQNLIAEIIKRNPKEDYYRIRDVIIGLLRNEPDKEALESHFTALKFINDVGYGEFDDLRERIKIKIGMA